MTRTDMPKKDYLAEMRRCSKCKGLKDKSEFGKDCHNKGGLNHQCKKCKNKWARADHKQKVEARFRELNQPSFTYNDERTRTTLIIEPVYRQGVAKVLYKAQIFSRYEDMGIDEIPAIKMKELRDWLNVKLKQEKK